MNLKKLWAVLAIVATVGIILIGYKHHGKSLERNLAFQNPLLKNAISEVGLTKLHMASMQGDTDFIEKLIKDGMDVNCKCSDGTTPLHLAAAFGQVKSAELLIANGADVNTRDQSGNTPSFTAVIGGQPDILELLISNGSGIDIRNKNGKTPLVLALTCKQNMSQSKAPKAFLSHYIKNIDKCIQILREHETK